MPHNADAFYDEGYYSGAAAFNYQDERETEYYDNFVHRARLKSIRRYLNQRTSGSARTQAATTRGDQRQADMRPKFLDVGCAFGAFVRMAAANFQAIGLDVSAFAVKEGNAISAGKRLNARLWCGDLTHLPKTPEARKTFAHGSFAAITLIEVAEHLNTPRTAFATAYELLAPGGVLVIQTANFDGWQAVDAGAEYHYYLPGHLVYFTATGLKQLLKDIGFQAFDEFYPTDFPLWAKWRKSWGTVKKPADLFRFWRMSLYHLKSKLKWRGRPLTSSYVLYARK